MANNKSMQEGKCNDFYQVSIIDENQIFNSSTFYIKSCWEACNLKIDIQIASFVQMESNYKEATGEGVYCRRCIGHALGYTQL